eukprot:Sspe_Gene.42211::Locus_20488_Transcript_1_1_Confidence_1.000_Length_391::g.42211::m.42211
MSRTLRYGEVVNLSKHQALKATKAERDRNRLQQWTTLPPSKYSDRGVTATLSLNPKARNVWQWKAPPVNKVWLPQTRKTCMHLATTINAFVSARVVHPVISELASKLLWLTHPERAHRISCK